MSANLNWLLDLAVARGALKQTEAAPAREQKNLCVKRYLQTVLQPEHDAPFLSAIEQYVVMMSQIRAAGSKLANLFAIRAFEANEVNLEDTLLDQTFVKWCLLPFKGSLIVTKKTSDVDAEDPPPFPELAATWLEYRHLLRPTYPPLEDLRRMSWDQALSDAAREYIGAFRGHVMTHFATRVVDHVRHRMIDDMGAVVRRDEATGRSMAVLDGVSFYVSDVYASLEGSKAPVMPLPTRVATLVDGIRTELSLTGMSKLSKLSMSDTAFKYHIFLSRDRERRGLKSFSACPVIKTHRTFSYLDDRVVHAITSGFRVVPSRGTANFATALGVDEQSWNAANKVSRSMRRRHRNTNSRHLCGKSSFPSGWIPTSAATDGVSVCVTLARPVEPSGPVPAGGLAASTAGVAKKKTTAYEERLAQFVAQRGRPHEAWVLMNG